MWDTRHHDLEFEPAHATHHARSAPSAVVNVWQINQYEHSNGQLPQQQPDFQWNLQPRLHQYQHGGSRLVRVRLDSKCFLANKEGKNGWPV